MSGYLQKRFGHAPAGAWLAERVWEPQLPYALSLSNIRYTLVDDVHFQAAGFEPGQLHGDYVCEDRARTVRVFPGLKALRYLLPFRSIERGMGYLRECANAHPGGMAAMGTTARNLALGRTLTITAMARMAGLSDSSSPPSRQPGDWLTTTPPGEWIATHPPLGRADLPTASYTEMMEWALPTTARREFQSVSHEFASRPDAPPEIPARRPLAKASSQIRGVESAAPKNTARFPGSCAASALAAWARGSAPKLADARTRVLRAQCNDAYWHGVFGGLYAPHLRTELWRELVRAETLAEEIAAPESGALRVERCDFDADGAEELYVTSARLAALLKPSDGGTLGALDFRSSGVTLINSMQRRVEALSQPLEWRNLRRPGQGCVASIHDQVRVKEPGLDRFLHYEAAGRAVPFACFCSAPRRRSKTTVNCASTNTRSWPAEPMRSVTTARIASA